MRHHKGQISIFIILGIIILLGSIVLITLNQERTDLLEEGVTQTIADLPTWAQPVNSFVENCITSIAIKGFKKIGLHGGYIDPFDSFLSGRLIDTNPDPTESDVVFPASSSTTPVSYWTYMASKNDCTDCYLGSQRPSMVEIEAQIGLFINKELPSCLDDFEVFTDQGFDVTANDYTTYTSIEDNGVTVALEFPVTLKKGNASVTIPSFIVELDLQFKELFAFANSLLISQLNEMFLEDNMLFLMGIRAGLPDRNRIPPIYGLDNELQSATWTTTDVQEMIKREVIGSFMQYLQVNRTRGATRIISSDPYEQGMYDAMMLDVSPFSFDNLKIDFDFNPKHDIYLHITPNDGGLLTASTTQINSPANLLEPEVTNVYEFFYDLSFPVIVTIHDNTSLIEHGEPGYTFRFAIEANIRNNKNLYQFYNQQGTMGELDLSNVQTVMNLPQTSEGSCTEQATQWRCSIDNTLHPNEIVCAQNCFISTTITQNIESIPSLECNTNQRISGDHNIKITKKGTSDGVEDMLITYTCGNAKACSLGVTNNTGKWRGKSQICRGEGKITLQKPGFQSVTQTQQILEGQSVTINEEVEEYQDKEVELFLINISNMFRVERYLDTLLNKAALPIVLSQKAKEGQLNNPILLRHIHRNPGSAQTEVLKIMTLIENKECICLGTSSCIPCSKANVPSDKLLPQEIIGLKEQFNLPSTSIYTHDSGKKMVEVPYISELHDARLKTLGVDHAAEVNPSKTAEALRTVRDVIANTNRYLDAVHTNQDLVRSITNTDGRANFDVDSLKVSDSTKTTIRNWAKNLDQEYMNLRIRTPLEAASDSTKLSYINDAWILRPTDQATIRLNKIKISPSEPNLPSGIAIINKEESTNLTLIPGDYEIDIMVQYLPGHVIARENLLSTVAMPGGKNFIAGQDLNHTLIGGSKITAANSYFTMTNEQLKKSKKIRFYAFHLDIPENAEDVAEVGNIEDYSSQYRSYIQPEFLP